MKPEDQRITIAIACGWKRSDNNRTLGLGIWLPPGKQLRHATSYKNNPPDFLNDLNAMHEAEKVLVVQDKWQQYMQLLSLKICDDADEPSNYDIETQWGMIHATSPQRAEAFLKTLGKWRDD